MEALTWSYSRYSTYEQCPRKFKHAYIDKIKEPSNEHMERGTKYHDLAERYINGRLDSFPAQLKLLGQTIRTMRKGFKLGEVQVESEWGFNEMWEPMPYKDAWLKMKIDCAAIDKDFSPDRMVIIDWKTGQYRDDRIVSYLEQLELYAIGALIMHPKIEIVEPRIGFLDHGVIYPSILIENINIGRVDLGALKLKWVNKVHPMLTDKEFICNNSWRCKYCYYRKTEVCDA